MIPSQKAEASLIHRIQLLLHQAFTLFIDSKIMAFVAS